MAGGVVWICSCCVLAVLLFFFHFFFFVLIGVWLGIIFYSVLLVVWLITTLCIMQYIMWIRLTDAAITWIYILPQLKLKLNLKVNTKIINFGTNEMFEKMLFTKKLSRN